MNRFTDSLAVLLEDSGGDKGEAKLKVVQEIAENFEVRLPNSLRGFLEPKPIPTAKFKLSLYSFY